MKMVMMKRRMRRDKEEEEEKKNTKEEVKEKRSKDEHSSFNIFPQVLFVKHLDTHSVMMEEHWNRVKTSLGPKPFLMVTCEKGGGGERKGSGETA